MGALNKQQGAVPSAAGASSSAAGAASSAAAPAAADAAGTQGLLLSIPAAVLQEASRLLQGSAVVHTVPGRLLTCTTYSRPQVRNGKQRQVAQGPLSVLIVDGWDASGAASPAAAPATPKAPSEQPRSGKLYPELYKGSGASSGSTSSIQGSEGSEGGSSAAAAAAAQQSASIVLAVADVAFEILPASQTLKVRPRSRGRCNIVQLVQLAHA